MRKTHPFGKNTSLWEFIGSRLEMDRMFSMGLAVFLTIASFFSMVAGVAVWSVAIDLRGLQSVLGQICSLIYATGLIAVIFCTVLSLVLALYQREHFRIGRIFGLNAILLWIVFSVMLISRHEVIRMIPVESFMGTLLWIIISFMVSYILTVLPAAAVTTIVGLVYKITDFFLPQ